MRLRFALALAAACAMAVIASGSTPSVTLQPCPSSSEQPPGAKCGQITVLENRAARAGRQIPINIVVLPARSPAGHSDPVFGIAGGPGTPSTQLAASYPRLYDALQADHDIVLVDQRGTGQSHPLVCDTTDLMKTPQHVFDELPDVKAITECRDLLAKDADLAQYTTTAAAADLDAVRQALGYSRINLLAVSYGTRVGLEYLRSYGPQVRAIAMSGVHAPSTVQGLTGARESQAALQKLFQLCAADSTCNGAFPNLSSEFDAVLTALEKTPATAAVPFDDKAPFKISISRTVFARELFQLLHSREDWVALPLAIHMASNKNFMPFAVLVLRRQLSKTSRGDGMALSVICTESPAFTETAIAGATKGTFLRDARARYFKHACPVWPHRSPNARASAPVSSTAAALLISGALDPVTPPQYADEVAKGLPNSIHTLVANVAHVPANPCVNGLIAAFLKAGSTKGLDTTCAANLPPIKFVTTFE